MPGVVEFVMVSYASRSRSTIWASSLTGMHTWIVAREGFDDDPEKSKEGILESIQMTWWHEID